jgi:hypothetical protein
MGLTQDELNVLTAEVVAGIYKPILALGGQIDQLRLEIIGTDTHTGEPITIKINHETTRNWPDD